MHVWDSLTQFNKTQLVIVNGNSNTPQYRDDVLRPTVKPFMRRHLPRVTFQYDNARAH